MKKLILLFFLFFSFNLLNAQEAPPDFFSPIIKKIKETAVALLKSLKPSEDQKKQAQGIMDEIKGYYEILKESVPDLPPSEKEQEELKFLRKQLDKLDNSLIEELAFIMDEVLKIADLKRKANLAAFDLGGWKSILIGMYNQSFWERFKDFFSSNNLNDFQKTIQNVVAREAYKIERNQLDRLNISTEVSKKEEEIKQSQGKIAGFFNKLIANLIERMAVVEKVGQWKKKHREIPLQLFRWKEVLRTRKNKGTIKGLSGNFVGIFMTAIHEESLEIQRKIIESSN